MGGAARTVTGDVPTKFGFVDEEKARQIGESLLEIGRSPREFDTRGITGLRRGVSSEVSELARKGLTSPEEETIERQLSEIRRGEEQARAGIQQVAGEQARARGFTGGIQDITEEASIQAGLPSFRAQQEAGILGGAGALQRQGLFGGLQLESEQLGRQAQIEELLSKIRTGQSQLSLGALSSAGGIFAKAPLTNVAAGPGVGQVAGSIFTQKFMGG